MAAPVDGSDRDATLALMLTPGLGPTLIGRCVAAFGSAAATLEASAADLATIKGISPGRASELRRALDATRESGAVARELAIVAEHGADILTLNDAAYPRLLRAIPDPPTALYVRGPLLDTDSVALAVIGARRCSHYGREQADRFAFQLAQCGLTIVSGGAYGIDIAAHRAALRARGRTLVVLGSGLAHPYPADHVDVFNQVVSEGRGAVLSEFPMMTSPLPEHFPRRNRIISGLSLGVLVIEAGHRSGALSTARMAIEEHSRECMVLPGRVDSMQSDGCHKLVRDGAARLVTRPSEVLDELGETGHMLHAADEVATGRVHAAPGASPTQKQLLDALASPRTLDQLVTLTGLEVAAIQADLTMLEIRGQVARKGGLFERRRP